MSDNTAGPTDRELLHRIEVRIGQLGLSERQLAGQAGMSTRYFRHLIESGPDFDPGGFLRLAAALGMTRQELIEGRRDAPAGQRGAARHPVLARLTAEECWERLGTHGVGRIAVPVHPGPGVFPVNYSVDGHTVVYRTAEGGAAAAELGGEISFEVDHLDEHQSTGWSVLLVGVAEHVTDPGAVRRFEEQPGVRPWAGGVRDLWIRIVPGQVSGRLIRSL
ncbi:pyridoxamine 5'-phosphate oxidase family protein [Kitasatospora sp. NPDC006697]|uniref:pyridoxamine 5'-phosphate oxidase family protein n=1 Tax=Kitasatospora sp. NPDC006697 TaxID=3364020 RepID=UPI00368087DE